jgi:hypothetical protein
LPKAFSASVVAPADEAAAAAGNGTGETAASAAARRCAKLCVIIVSYGRPEEVRCCLVSLAASHFSDFAVFICENGGPEAFERLCQVLAMPGGLLEPASSASVALDVPGGRLTANAIYRLAGNAVPVRIGLAVANLGYGGGVNAWLERLQSDTGWDAVLVLNPDTELDPACLGELMAKAAEGYGMVGAALVAANRPSSVSSYGLMWSRLTGRIIAVGRGAATGSEPSPALLARLDAISGACVLVTRAFVAEVGLMTEDYFLFMEDIDWGIRRGRHRIGVAARAIVRHIGGTAIGSVRERNRRSQLAVYLPARNSILAARRWSGRLWPVHVLVEILYALKYLVAGSPATAGIALAGVIDGIRGRSGPPARFNRTIAPERSARAAH